MSELININICLSDIPKDKIVLGKNGKSYINLAVYENRNGVDNYGNTHNISVPNKKEERNSNEGVIFVGRGKRIMFSTKKVENTNNDRVDECENLPF